MTTATKQDRDSALQEQRLEQFLKWMLPIAGAFLVSYLAFAVLFQSTALVIGAVAVAAYGLAILLAKRAQARGRTTQAAQLTGGALLAMVTIGVVGIPFQLPVLITIPLAAVAVVLPFLQDARLKRFMVATFGVTCWVVVMTCVVPPLFEQPPLWYQRATLVSAVLACSALTLRLLWVDAVRLRESLARAEAAIAVRDDFLLVASHEINTPLTPLSLKLESLVSDAEEIKDSELRGRVLANTEGARRQVRKLAGLVSDLLDGSRIGVGRLPLEPVDVDLIVLVNEVVARFEPQAAQLDCVVTVQTNEVSLIGRWDAARLDQVVSNLVTNALKYGRGKPIAVSVAREGVNALLKVRDEGIGVPADAFKRIFEKFERAVSGRNYGGLGLGLFITRKIVEAMGGTVWVESTLGNGATFFVRLPLTPEGHVS